MKYIVTLNDKQYEVEVEKGKAVAAYIGEAILDVRCQQGQTVKNGDILFILEAMKMENEIFANKDGTVTSVCVSKGASVDTGSVLCTIS